VLVAPAAIQAAIRSNENTAILSKTFACAIVSQDHLIRKPVLLLRSDPRLKKPVARILNSADVLSGLRTLCPKIRFVGTSPQQILILASVILATGLAIVTQGQPASASPHGLAQLAINRIDEHYLYASSAAWKRVRTELAEIRASDVQRAYPLVRSHLAALHDSDLHLVSPAERAAIQRESEGSTVGTGLIDFSIDVAPESGEARVVTPLIGSPAAGAGLRPGDVIFSAGGTPTGDLDHDRSSICCAREVASM
jgi:hypothetical protein